MSKVKVPVEIQSVKRLSAIEVKVHGSSKEDFEYALRAFKGIVQKERILSKFKERQYFEKPSVKKRRKRKEAVERRLQMEKKEQREIKLSQ